MYVRYVCYTIKLTTVWQCFVLVILQILIRMASISVKVNYFTAKHRVQKQFLRVPTNSDPLSIWTGFFQFSRLKYQVWWTGFFFPVWNQLDIFSSSNWFFLSFMARVKYFDGPCLTIYSLSTIYTDTVFP